MERQQAVSIKISKYLLKADGLYQHHLASSDGEQVTWNRWGVSGSLLSGRITSCSAGDSAYSYTFLRSVVCRLSVTFVPHAYTIQWIYMPSGSYTCGVQ